MFYTYAYLRKDGTPYYIGKGKFRVKRRDQERIHSKNKRIELPSRNRRIILKTFEEEAAAFKHEVYLIAVFGRKDLGTGILRNLTDGGEGASGRVLTETHKKRISNTNKGKKRSSQFRKDCRERALGNTNKRLRCRFRGKEFDSLTIAAEYFGCSLGLVSMQCERLDKPTK